MLPSSLYAEDTGAVQTLANGTKLHWTNQVGNLYTANAKTDLSICYTDWQNPTILTKATKTLSNYYSSCDVSEPDLGVNDSGVANDKATGWTRKKENSPRVESIYSGVVIANNAGYHYWGYNPLVSSKVTGSSGNTARFLLNADVNKMLFKITINAVDKTTLPTNADYISDPTSKSIIATPITLKELHDNPNKYLITSYSWGGALVYGENTSDHWRSVSSIYPAFILDNGDSVGGFMGKSVFGSYTGAAQLSFTTPNGHVSSGGGSSTYDIYSHLEERYVMGHPFEFVVKPDQTYQALGNLAKQAFLAKYGDQTASTHRMYVGCNLVDVGDGIVYFGQSSLECQLYFNPDPNLVYRKLTWSWNRYIKGETFLAYLAAFGLYFLNDNSYDPDTDNLTPDTLETSDKIYLGEMLGNGKTTGNWITNIADYQGINKKGKTNNPKYDPSKGVTGDIETDMPLAYIGGTAGMVSFIKINDAGLASADDIADSLSRFDITTIGKDLLRNFVAFKCYAVLDIDDSVVRDIKVAGHTLKDSGDNALQGEYIGSISPVDFSAGKIEPLYNDFRDYAPYTRIQMYVPFCGWFDLPSWCMGKEITGTMFTDLYNGTVKAVIYASRTVVAEVGGCCAFDIPFAAESTGMKAGAVISSALSTIAMTGATIAAPNIATGIAAVSSAANFVSAANSNGTTLKGVMGDGSNTNGLLHVYIKTTRPNPPDGDRNIPDRYKHEYGIPCFKQLELTAGDGYTQILDANITGAMTDREKQMIIDGFRHGLIL